MSPQGAAAALESRTGAGRFLDEARQRLEHRVASARLGHAIERPDLKSGEGDGRARRSQIRDHDHRRRTQLHDLLKKVDAVHVRHLDIERDDVRIERLHLLARLERIGGLADDANLGILTEGVTDQGTHGRRIIDDEDARGRHSPSLLNHDGALAAVRHPFFR